MTPSLELPLFPLNVVLFQGGTLPLNIFEPRYVRMIEHAIDTDTGFGVVLIREGHEVHNEDVQSAPEIHNVGTLASIQEHERQSDGRYRVLVVGGTKFRIANTWELEDHLRMAHVQLLIDEPTLPIRPSDEHLVQTYEQVRRSMATPEKESDDDFSDASWVSMRLAERLPMTLTTRQRMLELDNAHQRFDLIQLLLKDVTED